MESRLVDHISVYDPTSEKPMPEFQQEPEQSKRPSDHDLHDHQQERSKKEEKSHDLPDIATPSKELRRTLSLPEEYNKDDIVEDDDNDGFKTPTSLDHKIPAVKECPPAPRKPLRKRKASISPTRRRVVQHHVDLDILLSPTFLLQDLRAKIKKARQDQHDDTR